MKLNYRRPILTDNFQVIVPIIISVPQPKMNRLDDEMPNMPGVRKARFNDKEIIAAIALLIQAD